MGNQIDFGERIYDPRVGRFLSYDKLNKTSPDWSPYRFGFDNPIRWVDRDGNYETDGHYWTVYMLGLMIGLDNPTAQHLAYLAELPDNNVHNSFKATEQNYTYMIGSRQKHTHSLLGSSASRAQNIIFACNQLLTAKTDGDLSNALHYFGDAFAHQRMDAKDGYYGDRFTTSTWKGVAFEVFNIFASAEHSEAAGSDGKSLGNAPDLISNRPDLYEQYVMLLGNTMKTKFNGKGTIDMKLICKLADYAAKNNVSLIGIINYEVAKLAGQKTFFVAMNPGLANDNYSTYVSNTEQYLKSQGIKYTEQKVYAEKAVLGTGRGAATTTKVEQGTKFIIQ